MYNLSIFYHISISQSFHNLLLFTISSKHLLHLQNCFYLSALSGSTHPIACIGDFLRADLVHYKSIVLIFTEARFRRRSTHEPNLIDELSPAKERRLNQFSTAVLNRCGNVVKFDKVCRIIRHWSSN